MKVITLHDDTFSAACLRLAALIDLKPALIIGIRTGGVYVADGMMSALGNPRRIDVSLSRPSTGTKNRHPLIWKIIRALPESVRNILRMAESRCLSARRSGIRTDFILSPETAGAITAIPPAGKILVVDDSVDSGVTAATVMQAIKSMNPKAEVRLATLTATMTDPLVRPDFQLYPDHTLIRFPWSKDYRK